MKHWETNSRPSSEKVIGLTPTPGEATMRVSPSGVRMETSPLLMSVQYTAPSGPKARSSGDWAPSSSPQLSRISPLSGSIRATAGVTTEVR